MKNLLRTVLAVAVAAILCAASAIVAVAQITTGDVERALPPGSVLVREVQGGGAQVYTCHESAGAYVWVLVGPQALLINDDGTVFGVHTQGPKWTAQDGSSVAADGNKPLAKIARENSLPALLLPVTQSTGPGVLAGVLFVSRTDAEGGTPPEAGCDAEHAGTSVARHYSAVYRFFK